MKYRKLIILATFLTVSCAATADLNTGLVAYYPFNGNANDESGNGNNGTVNGATLTADRFGNANSAYSFNGSDQWINIPDANILHVNNLSISVWLKSNQEKEAYLLAKGDDGLTSNASFRVFVHSGPTINGNVWTSIKNDWIQTPYALNNWYHTVLIYDGNTIRLYINGMMVKSDDHSGTTNVNTNPLTIGSRYFYGNMIDFFNGVIDDIRIYNRVLSASEIQQLYQEGMSGIGGSVTNTKLQTVICKNVTTGQSVTLKRLKGASSWDCTDAGLQTKTGDVIKGTYTGTVR